MLLVVTTRMEEALPLIRRLKLTRRMAVSGHQVFDGPEVVLIISGPGKVAAAAATARILAGADPESTFAVSVCSCMRGASGEIAVVSQVRDTATGRTFYPDQLLRSGFEEITLTTIESPGPDFVESGGAAWIDREGSGFFESAAVFLPPSRIALLRYSTSDGAPSAESLLSDEGAGQIVEFLEAARAYAGEHVDPARILAEQLRKSMRLSETQLRGLRPLLRAYLDTRADYAELRPYLEQPPRSSRERNERYRELAALLSA